MKLQKPIELHSGLLSDLRSFQYKILQHSSGQLMVIGKFSIERETKERISKILRRPKVDHKTLLTEIEFWGWNSRAKYWGTFNEDAIRTIFVLHDIASMRRKFEENVLMPLEAIGVDMTAYPERVQDATPFDDRVKAVVPPAVSKEE